MRKAVRWLAAAFFFVLCGLFLFAGISEALRRKAGDETDMVHSFYSLDRDTVDVLCLGSSHGYSSIQANVLWGEYGIPAYVMCSPRQTAACSYYLLKEALRYQKPKVVLFESYYLRVAKRYAGDAFLRLAVDSIRPGPVKAEMAADLLRKKSLKEKLSYFIPFIKYHARWAELESYDFLKKPYLHGSILSWTVTPNTDPGIPEESAEMPPKARKYLNKIIKLCREEGIQLVVFAAPYGDSGLYDRYAGYQAVNNGLETYLGERDIPFLYDQKTGASGVDFETDFRDGSHLNSYGAEKFTRYIGEWLEKQYDMEDRRQEQGYGSWAEDYEKYQRDVALMSENSQVGVDEAEMEE